MLKNPNMNTYFYVEFKIAVLTEECSTNIKKDFNCINLKIKNIRTIHY